MVAKLNAVARISILILASIFWVKSVVARGESVWHIVGIIIAIGWLYSIGKDILATRRMKKEIPS